MSDYVDIIIIVLIVLGAFGVIAKFTYLTKRDIIDVHETNVRFIGLNTIIILFTILTSYYAYTSWFKFTGLGLLKIPLLLLFAYPVFSFIYSYFNILRYFKAGYRIEPIEKIDKKTDLKIRDLSSRISLKSPPNVLTSNTENISPFVFGYFRQSYLVFPSNFSDILDVISESKEVKSFYWNFVVLHELSHIKNGDHLLIGWILCLSRFFTSWLILLILVPLPYFFTFSQTGLTRFYSVYIYWLLCLFVSSYFLFTSFLRKRELLSDSRSFVHMPKSETISESTQYELVEQLLVSSGIIFKATIISGLRFISSLGKLFSDKEQNSKHSTLAIRKRLGKYFSVHPDIAERISYLRNRKYIPDFRKPADKGSSIWIGVILSIASLTIFTLEAQTGVPVMAALTLFLMVFHSLQMTSRLRNSKNYFSFKGLPIVIQNLSLDYLVSYLSSLILLLTLMIIPGIISGNPAPLAVVVGYPLIVHAASFVLSMIIAVSVQLEFSMSYFFKKEMSHDLLYFGMVFLGQIFILVISGVLLGMAPKSILVGFLPACALMLILIPLFFGTEGTYADCWRCYRIKSSSFCLEGKLFKKYDYLTFSLYFFIILTGPSLFFASIVERLFAIFSASQYKYIYLAVVAISCAVALLSDAAGWKSKVSKAQSALLLRTITWISAITRKLDKDLGENKKEDFKKYLENHYLKNPEAFDEGFKLVLGEHLYYVVSAYYNLGVIVPEQAKILRLVKLCEHPDGGFGFWKGSSARLRVTYFAIRTLEILNKINEIDIKKHLNWIKGCESKDGGFKDPYSSRGLFENTYYALKCLESLGAFDKINKERCMEFISKYSRVGKRGLEDTYYMLGCMKSLGMADENIEYDIRSTLVDKFEPLVYQLRLDKHPLEYFYLLSIIGYVYGKRSKKADSANEKIWQAIDSIKIVLELG